MSEKEIVLKSCPFCGGKAELYNWNNDGRGFVACEKCFVSTEVDLEGVAVDVWNRRIGEVGMNCCKCNVADGRYE